jgi:energy-converting hydrogenase Eha subunit B
MSRLQGALAGAVLGGALGFAGGFFGPILLTPEANQGPLLGIFLTGPFGAILGWVVGALLVSRSRRRAER